MTSYLPFTYIAGVWDGFPVNVREMSMEINENATLSPILGFVADTADMSQQITNLGSAYSEYDRALNCGALDVDTVLAEYQAKLKAGGIDEVIAATQAQLDAWKAEQGIE